MTDWQVNSGKRVGDWQVESSEKADEWQAGADDKVDEWLIQCENTVEWDKRDDSPKEVPEHMRKGIKNLGSVLLGSVESIDPAAATSGSRWHKPSPQKSGWDVLPENEVPTQECGFTPLQGQEALSSWSKK